MRPNRPKISVYLAPNRIEFSIRFDLMPIAKPDFWSPVFLCQVFDSLSLVTSSSWHHVSDLRGFIRSLSEVGQGQIEGSLAGDEFLLREVHGHMHARARGVGHGIASVRVLGKGSPQDLHSSTKNISFVGTQTAIFFCSSNGAGQSYGWSYFCLLNVIFGCSLTEISIQFSIWSFPNRIEYSVC